MSTGSPSITTPENWARLQRYSIIAAGCGLAVFFVFAVTPLAGPHPLTQSLVSYFVAVNFWLAFPLGCQVLLMTQYLTGGAWGVLLRPILEVGSRTLWLLALLFIPVVASMFIGSGSPYPWARPSTEAVRSDVLDELQARTNMMLSPVFTLARTASFFGLWLLTGYFLRLWSARWRAGDAAAGQRLPGISGPGLVVYGITISFAAMDWVLSLEPFWHSTMYPPIYGISQALVGMAFATSAIIVLSKYPPLAGRVRPKHLRDLGGLLLTFVMLWAYFVFSQFMLVWAGNLPDEAFYYYKRMRGGWQWIGIILIIFHFFVPFLLLLFRDLKETGRGLLAVAVSVLVVQFIDVVWWIEAAFPHVGSPLFWIQDIASFFMLGGVWSWLFLHLLSRTSLEPVHGPTECEPEKDDE